MRGIFRITTVCMGRLCGGFRTKVGDGDGQVAGFVGILGVVSVLFLVMWVVMAVVVVVCEVTRGIWRSGGNGFGAGGGNAGEMMRLYAKVDEKWPLRVFDERDREGGGCAVCLESLEVGSVGRRFGCGHVFHGGCIDRWVLKMGSHRKSGSEQGSVLCPLCKADVLEGDGNGGVKDGTLSV